MPKSAWLCASDGVGAAAMRLWNASFPPDNNRITALAMTLFSARRFAGSLVTLLRQQRWFVAAYLIHLAVSSLWYPTLLSRHQLWAELGPNYLWNAYFADFLANWRVRDYCYFPVVVRVLTLIVHALRVPLSEAGFVLNIFAWFFVNLCNASLAMTYFRRFVAADAMRFVLTLGFLFYDSYFVRAAINIAYPAFVPLCFLVADLPHLSRYPRAKRIALWLPMALILPSKPIYVAMAPSLAFFAIQGVARRRPVQFRFACSLLVVLFLMLVTMDIEGPGGRRHLPFFPLASTCALWFSKALAMSLSGRAFIALAFQHIQGVVGPKTLLAWVKAQSPIFYVYLTGSIFGAFAFASAMWRREHRTLRRTALHLCVMAGVGTALTFSSSQFPSPSSTLDFAKREIYPTAVVAYALSGIAIAHTVSRLPAAAAFVVPWMMASFPFGLAPLPVEPIWPCLGRSAWKQIIDSPQHLASGRGCATMDPIPWSMTGPFCAELFAPPTGEDWVSLKRFRDVQRSSVFLAPAGARTWEVDSVTMALRLPAPANITLTFRDARDNVLNVARHHVTPDNQVSMFLFDAPIKRPKTVELQSDGAAPVGVAMAYQDRTQPIWFWFGRGIDEESQYSMTSPE